LQLAALTTPYIDNLYSPRHLRRLETKKYTHEQLTILHSKMTVNENNVGQRTLYAMRYGMC